MKRKIKIAILDSGIDTKIDDLNRFVNKIMGFEINNEEYLVLDDSMKSRHIHGSLIAMIIKDICPNVEFIDINILDENLSTDGRVLIYALEEALKLNPDIIHLSLGTNVHKYKLPLKKLMCSATDKNITVVSATNNDDSLSYPAHFKQVIGVRGKLMQEKTHVEYNKGFFYAPNGVDNIKGINVCGNMNMIGNSMAAAYISGHIASIKYCTSFSRNTDIIEYFKNNVCNNNL